MMFGALTAWLLLYFNSLADELLIKRQKQPVVVASDKVNIFHIFILKRHILLLFPTISIPKYFLLQCFIIPPPKKKMLKNNYCSLQVYWAKSLFFPLIIHFIVILKCSSPI